MASLGNGGVAQMASSPQNDMSIGALLDFLSARPASRLTFRYDGKAIRHGYHVTEVKAGRFAALDCGANPEAWTEIFIQLWDVDDAPDQMTAAKFTAIIRKVADHVALDREARLTFEVSDGIGPMQLHQATIPVERDDEILVELSPRPASCKPRDRWLASQNQAASACCGSNKAACCA
ncbi:MAG: DUF6428 family protein [Pseudomonadota bacterium]